MPPVTKINETDLATKMLFDQPNLNRKQSLKGNSLHFDCIFRDVRNYFHLIKSIEHKFVQIYNTEKLTTNQEGARKAKERENNTDDKERTLSYISNRRSRGGVIIICMDSNVIIFRSILHPFSG